MAQWRIHLARRRDGLSGCFLDRFLFFSWFFLVGARSRASWSSRPMSNLCYNSCRPRSRIPRDHLCVIVLGAVVEWSTGSSPKVPLRILEEHEDVRIWEPNQALGRTWGGPAPGHVRASPTMMAKCPNRTLVPQVPRAAKLMKYWPNNSSNLEEAHVNALTLTFPDEKGCQKAGHSRTSGPMLTNFWALVKLTKVCIVMMLRNWDI